MDSIPGASLFVGSGELGGGLLLDLKGSCGHWVSAVLASINERTISRVAFRVSLDCTGVTTSKVPAELYSKMTPMRLHSAEQECSGI
jgi:hypothetical protein